MVFGVSFLGFEGTYRDHHVLKVIQFCGLKGKTEGTQRAVFGVTWERHDGFLPDGERTCLSLASDRNPFVRTPWTGRTRHETASETTGRKSEVAGCGWMAAFFAFEKVSFSETDPFRG